MIQFTNGQKYCECALGWVYQRVAGSYVAGKLRDYVVDGGTTMSVNLPQLQLPERADTHRIVHLHHNVPGVLATINGVLAEHKVNIEAQLLGTRGELGYDLVRVRFPGPIPDGHVDAELRE